MVSSTALVVAGSAGAGARGAGGPGDVRDLRLAGGARGRRGAEQPRRRRPLRRRRRVRARAARRRRAAREDRVQGQGRLRRPPARRRRATGAGTEDERRVRGVARGGARRRQEAEAGVAAAAGDAGDAGDRHVVAYEPRSGALVAGGAGAGSNPVAGATGVACGGSAGSLVVPLRRVPKKVPEPAWHPPWKLAAVVSGHLGWVRSVAFEPRNEWFATGGADRTIKIWDLAKCAAGAEGGLKLTLTGHINAIRGLAVSARTTYMFSAGEDKKVMCWDLETNKVVRHYHGHLSGVYSLALHPTLDLLMTGGRDSCVRVWDVRTSKQVMMLGGHVNTIGAIACNASDPQVITGSHDCTFSFASGAADNIKKWQCKDGAFLRNLSGHDAIVNAVDVNDDGVLASAADDGSLRLWDYRTGYGFQKLHTVAQPGSSNLKEDTHATPDSDPVDMAAWTKECRRLKRHDLAPGREPGGDAEARREAAEPRLEARLGLGRGRASTPTATATTGAPRRRRTWSRRAAAASAAAPRGVEDERDGSADATLPPPPRLRAAASLKVTRPGAAGALDGVEVARVDLVEHDVHRPAARRARSASRAATAAMATFEAAWDSSRERELAPGGDAAGDVCYWMSRDQRAADNWALLRAAALARERGASAASSSLHPGFLGATERAYDFMLKGLVETERELLALGYPFELLRLEDGGPGAGAAVAARRRWLRFAKDRNDPNVDAASHLSPYLHFGQLAPQRAALHVRAERGRHGESVASFLEEAVVRRELSDNFVHYEPNYDALDGAAAWARDSLELHASDPREFAYDRGALERSETHEDIWNAAQRQMAATGKMHGFMRTGARRSSGRVLIPHRFQTMAKDKASTRKPRRRNARARDDGGTRRATEATPPVRASKRLSVQVSAAASAFLVNFRLRMDAIASIFVNYHEERRSTEWKDDASAEDEGRSRKHLSARGAATPPDGFGATTSQIADEGGPATHQLVAATVIRTGPRRRGRAQSPRNRRADGALRPAQLLIQFVVLPRKMGTGRDSLETDENVVTCFIDGAATLKRARKQGLLRPVAPRSSSTSSSCSAAAGVKDAFLFATEAGAPAWLTLGFEHVGSSASLIHLRFDLLFKRDRGVRRPGARRGVRREAGRAPRQGGRERAAEAEAENDDGSGRASTDVPERDLFAAPSPPRASSAPAPAAPSPSALATLLSPPPARRRRAPSPPEAAGALEAAPPAPAPRRRAAASKKRVVDDADADDEDEAWEPGRRR
ncbi:hypothetical protein JL720_13118 [Aureococcus anophagefferens]|nr:hypothetical protein JL720_13118 [Aureococcus anophagefferens]